MNDTNAPNADDLSWKSVHCRSIIHFQFSIQHCCQTGCDFHMQGISLLRCRVHSDAARRGRIGTLARLETELQAATLTSYLTFNNNISHLSPSLPPTHLQNGIRRPRTPRNRSLARPAPAPPLPNRNPHRPRYVTLPPNPMPNFQPPKHKIANQTKPSPGFWLYSLNLRHLTAHAIDVPSLLRYHPSPQAASSVQRLALFLTLPLALSLLLYALLPSAFFPATYLLYVPLALTIPSSHLSRRGRGRFLGTLKRVSVGGLATDAEGRFADILMADVLTSYAKPLGDLWVVGCKVVHGEGVAEGGVVDRGCGGSWVVPGLIAVPFL